ncbi:MAG: ATP synthase F1 subunit delta [Hyphomonadaceae bacterium]|nr:ATP synthase F1 subunit delta [Hyphomonadaceae bacterium]
MFGFSPDGVFTSCDGPAGIAVGEISETDVAETSHGVASQAATRYAQAVFDLGKDSKSLDALEQDFAKFTSAWKESAELREAARSPLIEPEVKAKALSAVAAKLGMSDLGGKLVGVAALNRRAAELPAIVAAFRTLLARERGARQVEILSAKPLGAAEKSAIIDQLGKQLGEKVDAETRVDESLIGGFVVNVGSRQFDASVKSKLDALRLALKSA